MKYLITGGCGFLGSNLAEDVVGRGDELVVVDSFFKPKALENYRWLQEVGEFSFEYGDIRSYNDVSRIVQATQPDVIFHLAGQVAMTVSIRDPRLDFEVNALGTHNLLEAVRLWAPTAIVVFASTNKVYGDLENYTYRETRTRYECMERPNGFNETTELNFKSPYGCSKGAADQYVLDYSRVFGLRAVVFRHSSMYGGRQFATEDQGWVDWFCQKAVEKKRNPLSEPFSISGNGKQVRDILHVDDIKKLYHRVVNKIDVANGHAFNIGGGPENSLSLLELFEELEGFLDIRLEFKRLAARESDQRVFVADISKACAMLNWKPLVTAHDGLSRMLELASLSK